MDAVTITQDLLRIPSITPNGKACLDYIEQFLTALGFTCHRLVFNQSSPIDVDNLYAEYGNSGPNLCFSGHVDVVPIGEVTQWLGDPFSGIIKDDVLMGRGAVDMKGAIGAYLSAVYKIISQTQYPHRLSLMFTCDEEGPAINGTAKVVKWLKQNNRHIDLCIVGEPSCTQQLGDSIKIGRRGSLTAYLTVYGTQGHVAYSRGDNNPITRLIITLDQLTKQFCRDPYPLFESSNIEITTVDVDNPTENIIPYQAKATFNIRFNPHHTVESLKQWISDKCQHYAGKHLLEFTPGSESFFQHDLSYATFIQKIINRTTTIVPNLSTAGGTSDARFIRSFCPVLEFGLINQTMHQVNENVSIKDLIQLSEIYYNIIEGWPKLK